MQEWASRYFNAANAAFWATGRVDDFDLGLVPFGGRAAVPVAAPSENLGLPVGDDLGASGGVAVSMVLASRPRRPWPS